MQIKTFQGASLSARPLYFKEILKNSHNLSWLEIIVDNYLENKVKDKMLEELAEKFTLSFHSTSLSLGSQNFHEPFLKKIKTWVKKYNPCLLSDHICWTAYNNSYFHDLLPLSYNEETALSLARHIKRLQDFFEIPMAVENISSYVDFKDSHLSEAQFINLLTEEADCSVLLDVNNIYVNAKNRNTDPLDMIQEINPYRVKQYHLAGFSTNSKEQLIDTHSKKVAPEVWDLFEKTLELLGAHPTCIEWDQDFPSWSTINEEVSTINKYLKNKKSKNSPTKPPQNNQRKKEVPKKIDSSSSIKMQSTFSKALQGGDLSVFELIQPIHQIPSKDGVSIYKNNSRMNLYASLSDTFEATKKLLTDDLFKNLSYGFILKNSADKPLLSQYGESFPDFLEEQEDLKDLVFLKDLARLEWLIKESVLSQEERFLKTTHPVNVIYSNLMEDSEIEDLEPLEENHSFRILFRDSQTYIESIYS